MENRGPFPDEFGPYAAVFDYWDKVNGLGRPIFNACDFHVSRITPRAGDIRSFESNPHDIFPSELVALYKVRAKLYLPTLPVKHPLLDSPFAQVPESIAYEPDSLIEDAMAFAMELAPKVGASR
jgi:hypothetical protein